ncbi:MAG: Fe-S cluster assembly protein IscX [Alphaproteobacteria bacterium]
MKWTDILDIAIELDDKFPDTEILSLRFTELHQMICELDDFNDEPENSNEKILEAIQMAWLDERDN